MIGHSSSFKLRHTTMDLGPRTPAVMHGAKRWKEFSLADMESISQWALQKVEIMLGAAAVRNSRQVLRERIWCAGAHILEMDRCHTGLGWYKK